MSVLIVLQILVSRPMTQHGEILFQTLLEITYLGIE